MIRYKIKRAICEELGLKFNLVQDGNDFNRGFICPFCTKEVQGKAFAINFLDTKWYDKFHLDCLENLGINVITKLKIDASIIWDNKSIDFIYFWEVFNQVTYLLCNLNSEELISPEEWKPNEVNELEKKLRQKNKSNKKDKKSEKKDTEENEDGKKKTCHCGGCGL